MSDDNQQQPPPERVWFVRDPEGCEWGPYTVGELRVGVEQRRIGLNWGARHVDGTLSWVREAMLGAPAGAPVPPAEQPQWPYESPEPEPPSEAAASPIPAPPAPPPTTPLANWSLGLGIAGCLVSWWCCPILALCGPAAIVVAIKSRREEGPSPAATAGLVLGIITTVLILFAIGAAIMFNVIEMIER